MRAHEPPPSAVVPVIVGRRLALREAMGCGRSKPEVDTGNMVGDRRQPRKKTAASGATAGLAGRTSVVGGGDVAAAEKLVSRDPSDRYFSSRKEEESEEDDMRSEYHTPRCEPDCKR